MKAAKLICLSAAILTAAALQAQTPADPMIEPVATPGEAIPEDPGQAPPLSEPTEAPSHLPATKPGAVAPLEALDQPTNPTDGGFIIKDGSLNDIFPARFATSPPA